jgi:hypothetical protein
MVAALRWAATRASGRQISCCIVGVPMTGNATAVSQHALLFHG